MRFAPPQARGKGHRARPSPPRTAARARPRALPPVTTVDPAEQQADAAAAHLEAGRRDLARGLLPSPVAGARVTGSLGAPLPAAARARLERGFGADLSAVRIHRGGPAAEAAAAAGARAFAAGRDIYLGASVRDLEGDEGRRILAHEVAHVLQQTGRRGADGVLRATPQRGSAPVQRVSEAAVDDITFWEDEIKYESVKGRYEHEYPLAADLKAAFELVEKTIGTAFQPKPTATPELLKQVLGTGETDPKIATATRKGFDARPERVRSFFMDCFKALGEHAAARSILDAAGGDLRTSFASKAFYLAYRTSAKASWLEDVLKRPQRKTKPDRLVLTTLFYTNWANTYPPWLLSPGAKWMWGLDVQGGTAFDKRVEEFFKQTKDAKGLSENEPYLVTLKALYLLDQKRQSWMPSFLDPKKLEISPAQLKKNFAKALAGDLDLKDWQVDPGSAHENSFSPEQLAMLAILRPKVKDKAIAVRDHFEARRVFMSETEDADRKAALSADKRVLRFGDHLTAMAKGLFAAKAGASKFDALPTPDKYGALVATGRKTLAAHVKEQFELPLISQAPRGGLSTPESVRMGWVIEVAGMVDGQLAAYDQAADKGSRQIPVAVGKKTVDKLLPDHRFGHRIRLARLLDQIGYLLDHKGLKGVIAPVLQPGETVVALDGVWETSTDVRLGDMSRELGGGSVPVNFPSLKISIGLLEKVLYAGYYRELTKQLETLLVARKGDYTDKNNPILTDAVKAVAAWPTPERWFMPDSIVIEGSKSDATSASSAILSHERVAGEIHPQGKDYLHVAAQSPAINAYGVVVWAIPRMDILVTRLRTISKLDALVKLGWPGVFGGAFPETPAPHDWLVVVESLAQGGTMIGTQTVAEAVRQLIEGDLDRALHGDPKNADPQLHAGLESSARRATSHQRRIHEETRILPHWNAYDRGDIAKSQEPQEAARWMLDFTGFIYPEEDRPAQMAAMVIEVAEAMGKSIDTDLRDVPIRQVLPLISGALRVWAEAVDPRWRQRVIAIRRDDFTEEKLRDNVARLQGQEKKLKDWVESHQMDFGMIGSAESNTLRAVNETYAFVAGYDNAFKFEGVRFQLVKVKKAFRWHTDYPLGLAGGVPWPGEDSTGTAFLVNAKGEKLPPTDDVLFTVKIGNTFYDVKGTDTRLLGRVQHAIAMYSILKGLGKLASALEFGGRALARAMEFFPLTAGPARVARIITTVLEVMGSNDLEDLLAALGRDGIDGIKKYVTQALKFFDPIEFTTWILFDNVDRKFEPGDHSTDRQKQVGRRGGKTWAKVAAIARNILRLGKRMLARMQKLRIHAQAPVRRGHLFVVSHPGASLLARFMVNNWERLAAINLSELVGGAGVKSKEKDLEASVSDGIKEGANGILERGAEILNTLGHLELPNELVRVEGVVEWLIDTIVGKLGFEYQIGYELFKTALQGIDVWDDALKTIATELKKAGDPNELWRELVRDKINPTLVELRDQFVGDLKGQLATIPFVSKMVQDPVAGAVPIEAQTHGAGFEEAEDAELAETELFAREDVPSSGSMAAPPAPSSIGHGAPLPPAARAGAELRLGHDLSHVRMHAGSDAAAMTSAYHAEGVTTGSHVFMRPGLSPSSGFGSRVLHHELGHVLQQTGPRPLGSDHSPAPSLGAPGRGLHHDPAREAGADRIAAGGAAGAGAASLGAAAGVGLQPFGSDFFLRFMREMSSDKGLRANMEELEKGKSGAKILEHELAEDEAAKKIAAALAAGGTDSLIKAIGAMTEKNFTSAPFKEPAVAQLIVKYIADNADKKKEIENAIPILINKARRPHTTKKGQDGPVKTFHYIPPNALELELSDYLFAKTGVAIKVELADEKGEAELSRKTVVKPSKPIKAVSAGYLHLPFIGSTSTLWDTVIENTFEKSPTIKTKYASTKNARAEYKAGARLVLSRLGPRPGTYDKKAKVLKLGDSVATAIEAEVHPPTGDLPADKLPPVKEYIRTNHPDEGGKIAADAAYGHIGLRLGTYADYGPGGPEKGYEREAHHTTQYLLLEYLANIKKQQPFPVTGRIAESYYPGVTGTSTSITTIARPGATSGIAVAKYEAKRGGEMPIILIARHTHHSGIHVHAEPDESDGKKSASTPGQAVDNHFYDALGGADWRALMKDEKRLKALKTNPLDPTTVGTQAVNRQALGDKIFVAASKTYQWMWKDMREKLKHGLEQAEVEYYDEVASINGKPDKDHTIKASDMKKPFDLAVKWNSSILETGAGFDPKA